MLLEKRRTLLPVFFITASAVLAVIITALLPIPPHADDKQALLTRAAIAMVLATLYIGSAIWFIRSLAKFRASLRQAYIKMGIGLIIFSAAMIHLPILYILDIWKLLSSTYLLVASSGGTIVPFIIASIFMYAAMRQQAKLVGVHTWFTSYLKVTGLAVCTALGVAAVVLFIIPSSILGVYDRESIAGYVATVSCVAVFVFAAGWLVRGAGRLIGAAYKRALRWQAVSFFTLAAAAVIEIVSAVIINAYNAYEFDGWYLWTFIVAGCVFVRACYEFSLLSLSVQAVPAPVQADVLVVDHDYVESLLRVAQLASRPSDIDNFMDDLRSVTATVGPGMHLSDEQKQRLVQTYNQLEAYLMSDDPLRTFQKGEIREQLTPGFRSVVGG